MAIFIVDGDEARVQLTKQVLYERYQQRHPKIVWTDFDHFCQMNIGRCEQPVGTKGIANWPYWLSEAMVNQYSTAGDVLLLELNLGTTDDDGLVLLDYLRHVFVGAVILHSDVTLSPELQQRAHDLGAIIRCSKLGPHLLDCIHAAKKVAGVCQATAGWARRYGMMYPIPPYPEPTPFRQLMRRCWSFGQRFTGLKTSFDRQELTAIHSELMAHYEACRDWSWSDAYTTEAFRGTFHRYHEWYIVSNPSMYQLPQCVDEALTAMTKLAELQADTAVPV